MDKMDELELTANDVAEQLSVTLEYVWQLCRERRITHAFNGEKTGRRYLFHQDWIDDYIEKTRPKVVRATK